MMEGETEVPEIPAWARLCAESAICGIPIEELGAPDEIKAQAIASRDAAKAAEKTIVDDMQRAVLAYLGGEQSAFFRLFPGVDRGDYATRAYLTRALVAAFNAGVYLPKAQAAKAKNVAARTETIAEWHKAKAEGMKRAEYSRTRAVVLNRAGCKVTDRTIETRWLKGL